ncbi:iron-sulfur cluster insertion protein ErpA [Lacibacterium aquatile]|uniref:Iron-sulfur cluster insertion protein ErpA n=1 Tax=Lacibacterium aquatile TaxID=1168082 RepID=A0ABW5DND2_9PROT
MSAIETTDTVLLSDSAARRIAKLASSEGPNTRFRVSITGGGCSGFQYNFSFDSELSDEDKVFQKNDAQMVIDETSLDLMKGSMVDFIEDLSGSYFQIKNPQAAASCGCGNSFSPV